MVSVSVMFVATCGEGVGDARVLEMNARARTAKVEVWNCIFVVV